MNDEYNIVGNLTTIIQWLITTIALSCFGYVFDPSIAGSLAGAIAGILFSLINSYHLNDFSFLNNKNNSCKCEDTDVVE